MTLTLLPGIYVQTVPPPVAETLPRMDIAALVGFAASGPLHVPVMVESIAQFENIFCGENTSGGDYIFGWDRPNGSPTMAQLPQSLRAFFHNGGARCWVVRVASDSAQANTYHLPGVMTWDGASLKPAICTARSEGSWSDDMVVETALEQLPVKVDSIKLDPLKGRLKPTLMPGWQTVLAPGDLLRLRTPDDLFGFLSIENDLMAPEILWFYQKSDLSWTRAEKSPDAWKAEYRASVVTFRMRVRGAGTQPIELTNLSFCPSHDRYWAWLQTDKEMFEIPDRVTTIPAAQLRSESANPRFPVGGLMRDSLYLPLGMPDFYDDSLAAGADPLKESETALQRDGLNAIATDMFVDDALADVSVENLLDQAFYIRYQSPDRRRLRGMHALLDIDEVSLVAIPDTSQQNLVQTTYQPFVLGAPELRGGPSFTWSAVDGADSYLLDQNGNTLYEGPDTHFDSTSTPPCPVAQCFRVRAKGQQGYGPWSNTVVLDVPQESFSICDAKPIPAPALSIEKYLPKLIVSWSGISADGIEIQQSSDPGFSLSTAVDVPAPLATSVELWAPGAGTTYFRMRYQTDGAYSVWSNTVWYTAEPNPAWETDSSDVVGNRALEIQTALMKFCAGRGDAFAVLHAPPGYLPDNALSHESQIIASFPGDSRTTSFAALYYPWIITSDPNGNVSQPQVPDGAILGSYAARTLKASPWHSPANIPLAEVVALDPNAIGTQQSAVALALFQSRINLIRQQPRGFLTISAETLSDDPDYLEVNVRRLMITLRRLALREGVKDVFEPNDEAFRRLVQRHFDELLGGMFARGAFAGDTAETSYRVVTDSSVNTQQSLDLGRFIVELRVAPSEPLNFLIVRLMQSGAQVLVSEVSAGGR